VIISPKLGRCSIGRVESLLAMALGDEFVDLHERSWIVVAEESVDTIDDVKLLDMSYRPKHFYQPRFKQIRDGDDAGLIDIDAQFPEFWCFFGQSMS
jgi:hypothetical protein